MLRIPMFKNSSKGFFLFVLLLLSAGILQTPAESLSYPLTVTDAIGNRVRIPAEPQRIVIAGKASLITANVFYLFKEAREKVVAIGKTNQGLGNFLPYLDENFTDITELPHEVGPEQVVAHRPDLVIVKDYMYQRLGAPLAKLGIPVLALSLETADSFQEEIELLGKVLGMENRGAEIIAVYRERIRRIEERLSALRESDRPGVLLLYYSARGGETAFNIAPAGWMQTYQVEAAGGNPVWTASHTGSGWKTVNFEQIAAWDPDTIVLTSYNSSPDSFFGDILNSPQWKSLRASKENRVWAFPADFYSWAQPDVRWILGVQWLAKKLHPSLFSDLSLRQETETFYRDMYGLDRQTYLEVVAPRLESVLR